MRRNHFESHALVGATPAQLFEFLDDHLRLAAHMTQSSWMMAGSRMTIGMDEHQGHAIGSRITLGGRVLGIRLEAEEVITRYEPPCAKEWQTIGSPKLLVIGSYAMGFELTAREDGSSLRVFIDYLLPARGIPRLLGLLFGQIYAKWCTQRMVRDAAIRYPSKAQ